MHAELEIRRNRISGCGNVWGHTCNEDCRRV